jgi:hypothetical protein
VLAYETDQKRGLAARGLFGVIVRTLGLLMILWAFYTLAYFVNVRVFSAPTAGQPLGGFLLLAVFWLIAGLALLRGEWVVTMAYGAESR